MSKPTIDKQFLALAEPTRVRIIQALADGDMNCGELVEELEVGQSKISFHLKNLLATGLIELETQGRFSVYSLRRDALIKVADRVKDLAE